jgi:acyl-CoA synthetase (AMP-forming)/AMP-acid ligase II
LRRSSASRPVVRRPGLQGPLHGDQATSACADPPSSASQRSVVEWIARFIVARGVDRIFGPQGGHIQPIWDHLHMLGVRIVAVRDEGAAVHMAHPRAQLTCGVGSGTVGVAMLEGWCRERIAGFERPRAYAFIDDAQMPRTATGKVQHRLLRERLLATVRAA